MKRCQSGGGGHRAGAGALAPGLAGVVARPGVPAGLLPRGRLRRVVAPANGPAHSRNPHGPALRPLHVHQRHPALDRRLLAVSSWIGAAVPRGRRVGAGAAEGDCGRGNRRPVHAGASAGSSRLALGAGVAAGRVDGLRAPLRTARGCVAVAAHRLPGAAGARRAGPARALAGADPSGVVGQLPRVLRARSVGPAGVRDGVDGRAAATSRATRQRPAERPPARTFVAVGPLVPARLPGRPVRGQSLHLALRTVPHARQRRPLPRRDRRAEDRGGLHRRRWDLEPLSAGLLRHLSPGPGQLRPLRAPRRGATVSGAALRGGRHPGLAGHTQRRPLRGDCRAGHHLELRRRLGGAAAR